MAVELKLPDCSLYANSFMLPELSRMNRTLDIAPEAIKGGSLQSAAQPGKKQSSDRGRAIRIATPVTRRLSQKSKMSSDRATMRASELLITLTPTLSQRERGLFQSRSCGPLSFWQRGLFQSRSCGSLSLWERGRVRAVRVTISSDPQVLRQPPRQTCFLITVPPSLRGFWNHTDAGEYPFIGIERIQL